MNTKTAKRLRKQAAHHPNNEKTYIRTKSGGLILRGCSRATYQQLKREYNEANN